jgi:hypothetical protein
MSVLRVRGYALPDGEPVDLYADADQWTTDGVASAQLAAEGWLVPGLVDAHTHPGAEARGQALDESLLRDDLHEHVAAGVTMIRSQGLAGDPARPPTRSSTTPTRAPILTSWIIRGRSSCAASSGTAAPESEGYGAAVGPWRSSRPRPGSATTSPSARTTSPRLTVKRGHPCTSRPS